MTTTRRMWIASQIHLIDGEVDSCAPLGMWNDPDKAVEYIENRSDMDKVIRERQPTTFGDLGSWPMWIWKHPGGIVEVVTLSPLDTDWVERS